MNKVRDTTTDVPFEIWADDATGTVQVRFQGDVISEQPAIGKKSQHGFEITYPDGMVEAYHVVTIHSGFGYIFEISKNGQPINEGGETDEEWEAAVAEAESKDEDGGRNGSGFLYLLGGACLVGVFRGIMRGLDEDAIPLTIVFSLLAITFFVIGYWLSQQGRQSG